MENKHIIIAGAVGLVIILGILAVLGTSKSPQIGGDFLDLNKKTAQTQPSSAPTPVVTELTGQDLKVGTGSAVAAGDIITVHYIGMFLDGRKFDSSYERNEPFTFQPGANQIIPGFEQGVIGMKTGGKRRIFIPANLAYGDKSHGSIPPNTALAFDIELLEIKPKEEVPTPSISSEITPSESPTPTPGG